jgi:hypothetical protein
MVAASASHSGQGIRLKMTDSGERGKPAPNPSRAAVSATRAIVKWYVQNYLGTADDTGVTEMFCRRESVGFFAVDRGALERGEAETLFRLLVTITMFQRLSDVQIMRTLRSIGEEEARELTDANSLLRLADTSCDLSTSLSDLLTLCDLSKDHQGRGCCEARPQTACALKRHTVTLRRYGHFGKMPMSIALAIRDAGALDLPSLRASVWRETHDPLERAMQLESVLSQAWRVSHKIAAMFLSAVTNRALAGDLAPWSDGVDAEYFVVIDSNVDLALAALGYTGPKTYFARREFVTALATHIRLDRMRAGLPSSSPRLVQQALYLFMSKSNRRANSRDCHHGGPASCARCPIELSAICPLRKT